MTSQILQSVKKKIYAVCPDAKCSFPKCDISHEVFLAEVLRAINAKLPDVYSQKIKMGINEIRELLAMWNLLVNLDGQSEEVLTFLDGIL